MGFPENKKLAKDINKNTEDCTKQLETLLSSLNNQMGLMNSLISSISGGYVSKDYVDSGIEALRIECQNSDAALQTEINALTTKFNSKRYVGSDNDIAVLQSSSTGAGEHSPAEMSAGFVAKYNGVVRLIMTANFYNGNTGPNWRCRIWKNARPKTVSGDTNYIGDCYFTLDTTSLASQVVYATINVEAGNTYYFDILGSGNQDEYAQIRITRFTVGADVVMD